MIPKQKLDRLRATVLSVSDVRGMLSNLPSIDPLEVVFDLPDGTHRDGLVIAIGHELTGESPATSGAPGATGSVVGRSRVILYAANV